MTEYVSSIVKLDTVKHSPSYGSVIPLNDGRLLWVWGPGRSDPIDPVKANHSQDGGETWSSPADLVLDTGEPMLAVMDANLLRLQSGELGLAMRSRAEVGTYEGDYHASLTFSRSADEGATWSTPVQINPSGANAVFTNERSTVLKDGRIIVPFYTSFGARPSGDEKTMHRYGEAFGSAERGGLSYSSVYYSDDEGRTWQRSRNEVIASLENGVKGSFSMGEPAVVELQDGRVLMLARTNLGRFFQSYSDDRGDTWYQAQPTGLACFPSPCNISRIPSTGDLLVIWNQLSAWEIRAGLYRHRLSCAVSGDDGLTCRNHRNLESLDDTSYVEPGPIEVVPIRCANPSTGPAYHRAPGPLRCNQPTCAYLGDKIVITYGMCVFGDKAIITDTYGMDYDELMERLGLAPFERGNRVRVVSTDWFYE